MDVVLIKIPALLLAAALATGQQAETPKTEDVQLPVSVKKIQKAISRPPAIKAQSDRPVFRVEVFARKPTIEDILGPNYLVGPVAYGGMTHQEFLNMVTPSEFRGMGVFTGKEALSVAATTLALHWGLLKAMDKLKEAKDARAKDAARREVIDAMNELDKARRRAGLASVKQP